MIVTVDRVVATPEAKAQLLAETGAMAVDMESAAVLFAAASRHWPALVVRGVSDAAGEALNAEVIGLLDDEGRLRAGRAVRAFLARPGLLRQARELQRSSGRALAAVAEALRPLLN
jgi:adenosylhomocysteine nucleosidase